MNHLISDLIHSSKGYFYETAGIVLGFFNDPERASQCAHDIRANVGKTVEVCGSQLSILL
jgi:hypothetical protein